MVEKMQCPNSFVKSKIENEENSSPEVLDLIGIGWHEKISLKIVSD